MSVSFVIREIRLERVEIVPHGEGLKALTGLAVPKISRQHFFEDSGNLLKRQCLENLPSAGGVLAKTPANENVIRLSAIP
jgi:hypothetical protein